MAPHAYTSIDWHLDAGVLRLTLDRPDQLNAFTVNMCEELIDAFSRANEDDAVLAVVITGAGRAFCAGMDLSGTGNRKNSNLFGIADDLDPSLADMVERFDDPAMIEGARDDGGRLALAIHDCRKPVIAAINGPAVGVGATMTLAMDFRLASTEARIGFIFGRIGIVPESCSTWFLPRIVGYERALELSYCADILSATQAYDIGLVRSVHEPGELLPAAEAIARRVVTGRSPLATALTRQMMRRNAALPSPAYAHRIESLAMIATSRADGVEGVAAFLEKRDPHFGSTASQMPPFYDAWIARDSKGAIG